MQDFTQLKVWQKAHSFTVNLYKITKDFPFEEKFPKGYRFAYGLTNQIRRATVSIESNISEGCGRNGDKEFSRFLERESKIRQSSKTTICAYALRSR